MTDEPTQSTVDPKVKELEDKLGQALQYIEDDKKYKAENQEFIRDASVVINTLAFDENLRTQFRETLKKNNGVVEPGEKPSVEPAKEPAKVKDVPGESSKIEELGKRIDTVESTEREKIVRDFEGEYGFDKLNVEEAKTERRKVEEYLRTFGLSARTAPTTILKDVLNKAYIGTHAEKLKEEGKLEGFAQARTNEMGAMGGFSSSSPNTQGGEVKLTEKQAEWAKKLGVDPEGAAKTYAAKGEEQSRLTPNESKK